MLKLTLFKAKSFTWGTLSTAFMTASVFGLLLVIPQYALDTDPLGAGIALAPIGVGMALGGPIISRPSWPVRKTVLAMLIIQPLATLAAIPFVQSDAKVWWMAVPLIIDGFAWGTAFSILVAMLMSDIPKELSGVAGGTQTAARLLAGAVGGAILTTILLGSVAASIQDVNESALSTQEQTEITQLYEFSAQIHPRPLTQAKRPSRSAKLRPSTRRSRRPRTTWPPAFVGEALWPRC